MISIDFSKVSKSELDNLKDEIEVLENKISEIWHDSSKHSTYEEYLAITYPLRDLLQEKNRQLKLSIADYELEPIPSYGDLFTMSDFIMECECGGFIDDDGIGYYALEDKVSDIEICPSDVIRKSVRTDFTHVAWYNK